MKGLQRHALYVMAWCCDKPDDRGNLLGGYMGDSVRKEIGCSNGAFWKYYRDFEAMGFIVTLARGGACGKHNLGNAIGIPSSPGALDALRVERRTTVNGKGGSRPTKWDKSSVHAMEGQRPRHGGPASTPWRASVHAMETTNPIPTPIPTLDQPLTVGQAAGGRAPAPRGNSIADVNDENTKEARAVDTFDEPDSLADDDALPVDNEETSEPTPFLSPGPTMGWQAWADAWRSTAWNGRDIDEEKLSLLQWAQQDWHLWRCEPLTDQLIARLAETGGRYPGDDDDDFPLPHLWLGNQLQLDDMHSALRPLAEVLPHTIETKRKAA